MKEILTNNGFSITVDDEDYERLSQYNWRAYKSRAGWRALARAAAFQKSMGRNPRDMVYLHWMVLPPKDGYCIDHINRNTLDNRKCNLRYVTNQQNQWNKTRYRSNSTGYIGVSWKRRNRKYEAHIACHGKQIHVGLFASAEDAARARDAKAVELFGEYAALNFPDGG